MKYIICLFIILFAFTTCFNSLEEETGTLTINLGSVNFSSSSSSSFNNGRSISWPHDENPEMFNYMEFFIVLTGTRTGNTISIPPVKGVTTVKTIVPVGFYSLKMDVLYNDEPYAKGLADIVRVRSGRSTHITVTMELLYDGRELFSIELDVINAQDGDSITAEPRTGYAGDEIIISYTLTKTSIYNNIEFSINNFVIDFVDEQGIDEPVSGTIEYIIDEDDALQGTITITAIIQHTGLIPDPFEFNNPGQVDVTYGNADAYRNPISNMPQGGVITYTISPNDGEVAEVDEDNGIVTIKKAGTVTITANKTADDDYAEYSKSYTLTINPRPVTIYVDQPTHELVPFNSVNELLYRTLTTFGITINDLVNNDNLTITLATETLGLTLTNNSNVGSGLQTITLTYDGTSILQTANSFALGISDNSNYVISGTPSVNVTIYDGIAANRAIPVTQNNITQFNSYAASADGLARHYRLTENITLVPAEPGTSNWTPIGSSGNFTGSLEGDNNSISGLTIETTTGSRGLFAVIGEGGVVQNLTLANVNIIQSGSQSGAVVGRNNGTIKNCHVSIIGITGGSVGGIAGESSNTARIENCSVTGSGTINPSTNPAGGVVGANRGIVINSFSTVNLNSSDREIGGLAGSNSGTISYSYATGNVVASGTTAANSNVGGVVGRNLNTGTISNCYSIGNVTSTGGTVGGVVGRNEGEVTNCYAAGDVFGSSNFDGGVGGVVGRNHDSDSNVLNSVALNGTIAHHGVLSLQLDRFGRIVGRNTDGSSSTNNYARADMTGDISPTLETAVTDGKDGANLHVWNSDFWTNLGFTGEWWSVPGRLPNNSSQVSLNITSATHTKIYDGTTGTGSTNVSNLLLSGIIGGDDVSIDTFTASYTSANAGTRALNISNVTLKGEHADYYTVPNQAITMAAGQGITQRTLTIASVTHTRPYDATITANVVSNNIVLSGVISGDTVQVSNIFTAEYTSMNAGTRTLNFSNINLSGAQAGNYTVPNQSITMAEGQGITQRMLTTFTVNTPTGNSFGNIPGITGVILSPLTPVTITGNIDGLIGDDRVTIRINVTGLTTQWSNLQNGNFSQQLEFTIVNASIPASLTITFTTLPTANYTIPARSLILNVRDGHPGEAFSASISTSNRRIPLTSANINSFNTYINSNNMEGVNRHYYLAQDIILTPPAAGQSNWVPITFLGGSLDGEGRTISNVTINRPTPDNQCFIGTLNPSGVVRRIGLLNVNINGGQSVGGIVGQCNGTIEYAYTTGLVTGDAIVGGIAGEISGGTVRYCYSASRVEGNINASSLNINIGGIAGILSGGTIQNSYSVGNIRGRSTVGGIVGINRWEGVIENCYATGIITGETSNSAFWPIRSIGGIVGNNSATTQNNVALNSRIVLEAAADDVGRVAGVNSSGGTLTYNQARSDMNVSFAITSNLGGKDGLSRNLGTALTTIFSFANAGWSTTYWERITGNLTSGGQLPRLIGIPVQTHSPTLPAP